MRVIQNESGHIMYCTCLICMNKFASKTLESFCPNCFKINSDIQLKAIKEAGKSYEDFMIEMLNNARRQYKDENISHVEMTEAEAKEMYNLFECRLKNPIPLDEIKSFMGFNLKIIK